MSPLPLLLILPAAAGLASLAVRSFRVVGGIVAAAFAATLALGIALVPAVLAGGAVTAWGGFLRADALSVWMVLLVSVVSLATSLYAGRYFQRDLAAGVVTPARAREFFVLTPLFGAGMHLVVLANSLGVMWAAVEATALSSVLLVALYNRRTSLEGAWKYVILGSVGLALALLGTVFLYAAACRNTPQPLPSLDWSHLLAVAPQLDPRLVRLAFVLALVGYGTKAGLAPLHTWLPDAHSEAPSPTSAMLSGVSLKVALYALLRFHILATASLGAPFSGRLLLALGLLSLLLAAPFMLVQQNLKRMLAYSSLEHVGLICVGVGLGTPVTVLGALLHMGYHALAKPALFFAAGNIHQHCHALDINRIGRGLLRTLPATALGLALAATAAAGLPPFGLFFSELLVIGGALLAGHTVVAVLVLAAVVACACGLLLQLSRILPGAPPAARPPGGRPGDGLLAMGLLLGALLVLSVWLPAPARSLLGAAAGIIGGSP